jgi:multimeric flavodoxin WrbA
MKVILLNGSPHQHGCTATALEEVASSLQTAGIATEIFQLGPKPMQDCIACFRCHETGKCVFDDAVNEFTKKAREADGFVFGTPVYFAHPTGRILSFLDRVFISGGDAFVHKPGAIVASARRAGTTASLDALSKYLNIDEMIQVGSSYWNMVHGNTPDEVRQDLEGMQVMRRLGTNMAWILKCMEAGQQAGIKEPGPEEKIYTNFIR